MEPWIILYSKWPALQVDLRHYITGQQREQPAVDGDEHLVTVRHNIEDRHPDDDAGERPGHSLGCGLGGSRLQSGMHVEKPSRSV